MKVVKGEKEVAKVFVEDGDIFEVKLKGGGIINLLVVRFLKSKDTKGRTISEKEFGLVNLRTHVVVPVRMENALSLYEYYRNKDDVACLTVIHNERLTLTVN